MQTQKSGFAASLIEDPLRSAPNGTLKRTVRRSLRAKRRALSGAPKSVADFTRKGYAASVKQQSC